MLESFVVAILIAVSVLVPGKDCLLFLGSLVVAGVLTTKVFSTLGNNWTELLNCFWSGPTSAKSLGTLFILSFIKTMFDVVPSGSVGKGIGAGVAAVVTSG